MPRTFGMRPAVSVPHYVECSEYACKHLYKRLETPAHKGIGGRVVGSDAVECKCDITARFHGPKPPFDGTAMLHDPNTNTTIPGTMPIQ